MGKGGKNNQQQQPRKKKPQPEPEPSQEDPQVQDALLDDQQEQIDYFDPELSDRDEELLQRINQEIVESNEPLKMTWAAIYKLKEEQKQLNQKMDEEMIKIQQKYDQLKHPLNKKIAKIVAGQVFEKQLYTEHQLTKNLSINKHKPQAIPGFWKIALQSIGFIQCDQDAKILQSCTQLQCTSERKFDQQIPELSIKVVFHFANNDFISNKELKLEINKIGDELSKNVSNATFKKPVPQDSIFKKLFNSDVTQQQVFGVCEDLQRAYNNSVFYYFYQGKLQEEIQEQQQGQESSDSDQEQDEDSNAGKRTRPKNKRKGDDKKKQPQGAVEKPECKNQ